MSRLAVWYPDAAPTEVCFLENIWRAKVRKIRRHVAALCLLRTVLPTALISYIAALAYPLIVVTACERARSPTGYVRGSYVLDEEERSFKF